MVDENLPPNFAGILRLLDHDAHDIRELDLGGAEDAVWIPAAATIANVIFSTDANISRRKNEIEAVKRAGMVLFAFRNGRQLAEWLACFLRCEREIELLVSSTGGRGKAFQVRMRGRILPLNPKAWR